MRVHLGSDHAGLDLKAHLASWLTEHGYEPVDHGPVRLRRAGRLPGLLPAGRRGRGARPRRPGLDSFGVVIGGSGNGEQIAANKVPGIRCALAWSEETAEPGPRAQRRQGRLGRRPDALGRGHDPVRRGLPRHGVQRRRAARTPDRPAGRATSAPASCRRCPSPPRAGDGPRRCLRATPSTGSPPRSTTRSPDIRSG